MLALIASLMFFLRAASTSVADDAGFKSGVFDPPRFRPNVLVDTDEAKGFVEDEWVGRVLALGDEVRLRIYKECGRCVMTTLPQGGMPSDTGILRTVMKSNSGKLGVLASVQNGGRVKRNDQVLLM